MLVMKRLMHSRRLVAVINPESVLAVLYRRLGRDNGITVRELVSEIVGQSNPSLERKVRNVVPALIRQGIPVCSHPSWGYWIASSTAEIEESARFHHARAMHELVTERNLRKRSLPQVAGQLALPVDPLPEPEAEPNWETHRPVIGILPRTLWERWQEEIRSQRVDPDELLAQLISSFLEKKNVVSDYSATQHRVSV